MTKRISGAAARRRDMNLVNQTFEYLTVVALASTGSNGNSWRCRCACGTERVLPQKRLLGRRGRAGSCGSTACAWHKKLLSRAGKTPKKARCIITVEGGTAYVHLAGGQVARIDAADAVLVQAHRWYLSHGYPTVSRAHGMRMSRLLLDDMLQGAADGKSVDHLDGDPLNNQRSNLRICTHEQNMRNQKIHRDNTVGYKGVSLDARRKCRPYKARIVVNYAEIHLGMYATAEEAALAYNEAAIKHHGAFARLNVVPTRTKPNAARRDEAAVRERLVP